MDASAPSSIVSRARRGLGRLGLALLALVLAGCAADPLRVNRAVFGGSIWGEGQRRAGVMFQDGAQSFPVAGGTLWSFGDTFLGKPVTGLPPANKQITGANWTTLAWLSSDKKGLPPALVYYTGTNGMAACPLALLPGEDPKHRRLWPAGGISAGRHVYLYYSLIETTDAPGPWNFHGLGGGLAVADGPLQPYVRLQPDGNWKFPVEPVQVVREGDELYLFEISSQPKGLILARVKAGHIERPSAYEFYNGRQWTASRDRVKVILREAYGQVSVKWIPGLRQYVMATSSDFYHPLQIQLRQSSRLEGPWSEPIRIAVPEMPGKKTTLVYCTFLHPELSEPNPPRLVATFCRMLAGSWELSNPESVTLWLATGVDGKK